MPCLLDGTEPSYISDYQLRPRLAKLDPAGQAALRKRVAAHNQAFVARELARHRLWFDGVEKTPLTPEQRKAAVVLEDRNLLVAAAGSGKTSTMVAKVGYALRTGRYTPADILVLAFNTKAAQELRRRIHQRLPGLIPVGQGVTVKTFHALGLGMITAVRGYQPRMGRADNTGQSDALKLKRLIRRLIHQDAGFAQEWMLFRLFYCREVRDPSSFITRRQWHRFVRTHGNIDGRRRGFLTFRGELVGSQCEQAVANWLYMYGIAYVYKNRSFSVWPQSWSSRSISGFLLTESQVWIQAGASPGVRLGAKDDKHSTLVVSFADFIGGRLFRVLRHGLKQLGLTMQPSGLAAVVQHLGDCPSTEELIFLTEFIKHARSNQLSRTMLKSRAACHPQVQRAGVLLGFISRILRAYIRQFSQADELDFPEMLRLASQYVATGRYVHPYTLILVDEFQDTSQASAGLLAVMLQQAPACKLFAVGDDWQSIYRFAGADNRIFTGFQECFGATAVNYLSASFRFNQGIADIATRFIQKNPQQITKQVRASDPTRQDVVLVHPYRSRREMGAACCASLEDIQKASSSGEGPTVYILARYRHQRPAELQDWQSCYTALNIQFMTIHAAKGLEADYVLVLGLHGGRHAFPARINNDPLLQLVMPAAENWPDAEERRLLYVAITRARHKVYLIASVNDASDFVTELSSYPEVKTLDLPSGQLPPGASRF